MIKKLLMASVISLMVTPAWAGGVEQRYKKQQAHDQMANQVEPRPMPQQYPQYYDGQQPAPQVRAPQVPHSVNVPPPSYHPAPKAYVPVPARPEPYVYQPPVYVPPPAPVYTPPAVAPLQPCGFESPCGEHPSRFGIYGAIGAAFIGNGDLISETSAVVVDYGPVTEECACLDGVGGTINVGKFSFSDVYSAGVTIDLGMTYEVSRHGEVFGGVSYTRFGGGSAHIGNMLTNAPSNRNERLMADFSDYSAITLEGGYRHYLSDFILKPYIGGRVGATLVDEITATFTNSAIALDHTAVLYDSTLTYKAQADLGFIYAPTHNFGLGLETGVAFNGALDDNDEQLTVLSLEEINGSGGLTYVPLKFVGRFNF